MKETYNQSIVHFVELEDRYAIDARLLGRRIRINISDECLLRITIPSLVVKNGFPKIEIPGIMERYNADISDWGCVKSYSSIGNLDRMNVWISAVLVECFSNNNSNLLKSSLILAEAKKVLHSLQIINPYAIRTPSDVHRNELCKVDMSVSFSKKDKPLPAITLQAITLDDRGGKLSISNLKSAFQNAHNPISAPYEMLNNARISLAHHDTRSTVLNCATAIEVMLKRKVYSYLDNNNVPQVLGDYVIKKADGFGKLAELCKTLNINLTEMPNVQKVVMDIRNRVIHGGYIPSNDEAQAAYNNTKEALRVLNVPLFEVNDENNN